MTILYRNVLTANRRSNNLKEHREGFESVNGVGPVELPDPKTQMSGMISQLLEFKYIKAKEITDTAFQIRRLPEIKGALKHMQVLNMIAKALGYHSHNELIACSVGEDKIVTNRNFGNGLVYSHVVASAEQAEKIRKFWELCSEVFLYVKTTDINFHRPEDDRRAQTLTDWFDNYVHPVCSMADIVVVQPEGSMLNWTPLVFSMALAAKYQINLSRGTWKKAFKGIPGATTEGDSRGISMELMARPLKYLEELGK